MWLSVKANTRENEMCLGVRKEAILSKISWNNPENCFSRFFVLELSLIPTKAVHCMFKQGHPLHPGRQGSSNLFRRN